MRLPLCLSCLLLLASCDVAPPPPSDPDAKAEAKTDATGKTHEHQLQQGIDAVDYRDKAAHANDAVIEADKKREQELNDAGG